MHKPDRELLTLFLIWVKKAVPAWGRGRVFLLPVEDSGDCTPVKDMYL